MNWEREECYHKAEVCEGTNCPFHNPSDHKMKDWPKLIRFDRGGMTERLCIHGVGHPDPDSLDWMARLAAERHESPDTGVHGCDGCCMEESGTAPLPIITKKDDYGPSPLVTGLPFPFDSGLAVEGPIEDFPVKKISPDGYVYSDISLVPKEKFLPTWLSITLKLLAIGWLICLFLALKH